jgi:predicted transcriptional regulator
MLAIPQNKTYKGKWHSSIVTTDDFKSLARMKVSGEITDENDAANKLQRWSIHYNIWQNHP